MMEITSTQAQRDPSYADWMWELARHYELMRTAYPEDELCIVFDIDGTILDMRYLVVHVLLSYDRAHGSDYFHGLGPDDVTVHENRIGDFLAARPLPQAARDDVLEWCADHLWTRDAMLAGARPYRGVFGVIRWFQIQPKTRVALNTGRPEKIRSATLETLNALGDAYRVAFDPGLLVMNPHGWNEGVTAAKAQALSYLRDRRLRVVAVVDNEPANILAMAEADSNGEILFLHADTIFESQRQETPRTVSGSAYGLKSLVSEKDLARRVRLVWHGLNDEANLRHFLASEVGWGECDVRQDPLGRLVLRHDSFEDAPWSRREQPLLLEDCLYRMKAAARGLLLDLKGGKAIVDGVLQAVKRVGLEDSSLWFSGRVEDLGESAIRRLAAALPGATLSVPVDFAAPLLLGAPELAGRLFDELTSWGVTCFSLPFASPRLGGLVAELEARGRQVNIYGVPDLESFLEATLLLPHSVTADFNFPDWHYFGRGSGMSRTYHRYDLAAG